MASTTSMRQAIASSQHSVSRRAARPHSSRRPMVTTSAMSLQLEDASAIDLQIFDIFDAPSRLGESSKLLARASSLASGSRVERAPSSTAASTTHVLPLPNPIVFDGPARPKHLSHGSLRARQTHTHALSSPTLTPREPVSPLPPPIMFDGPSRLRPYVRGGSSEESNFSPTSMLAVAATGAVAYASYKKLKEDSRRQGGDRP